MSGNRPDLNAVTEHHTAILTQAPVATTRRVAMLGLYQIVCLLGQNSQYLVH